MIVIATLFLLSLMGPARASYLIGAHHIPHHPTHSIPTVLSSRSFAASSSGPGPASGYSSSTYSQTVAAPARVHSSYSTQHPASGQRGSGGGGEGGSGGQQQGGGGGNQHLAYNYIQNQGQGSQGGHGGSNQGNLGRPSNQGQSVQNYREHGQGSSGGQGQRDQGSRGQGQGQSGYASFTGIASGHHYQYGYNHY